MNVVQIFKKHRRRFVKYAGGRGLRELERLVTWASLVETSPILDPRQFEWVPELERNWEVMRRELDGVLMHLSDVPNFQDISPDQRSITQDDMWKMFFLFGFGYTAEKNCALCPETARLVSEIPGMVTASFSILSKGKYIPPHRGLYRGVLRYHLGLKVPDPPGSCRIRVDDQIAHWEEGRSLLFDDTYEHEVWNESDGIRVVLFLDILRPLRPPVSDLNRLILWGVGKTPYVQDARKNYKAWSDRMSAQYA